jgi:hypothetical protein
LHVLDKKKSRARRSYTYIYGRQRPTAQGVDECDKYIESLSAKLRKWQATHLEFSPPVQEHHLGWPCLHATLPTHSRKHLAWGLGLPVGESFAIGVCRQGRAAPCRNQLALWLRSTTCWDAPDLKVEGERLVTVRKQGRASPCGRTQMPPRRGRSTQPQSPTTGPCPAQCTSKRVGMLHTPSTSSSMPWQTYGEACGSHRSRTTLPTRSAGEG